MNVHHPTADLHQPGSTTLPTCSPQERDVPGIRLSAPADTVDPQPCEGRAFQAVAVFPAELAAVSRARRNLHQFMCRSGLSSIADTVALGAQELMANAVTHGCRGQGAREFTVRASCRRGRFRVEVQDPSAVRPVLRAAGADCEGGRGLVLVDALASRWGVQPGPGRGKTIWMELDVAGEEDGS
ncbi:ATP-binding protein [Streptomyces sp. NPDC059875]|uniref:ATP-binding protein n=1 Tax=unclassified Streptomyces TaxID=2593676 RepID=UPI003667340C